MDTPRRITEEEIAELVDRFYAKVRKDPEIGPVFNESVQNWDAHLSLLKDFWSTVLLTTGRYKGNPLLTHFPLPLQESHFARWLQLFRATALETMPDAQAAQVVQRAEQIAVNMQRVLGDRANLMQPPAPGNLVEKTQ